MPRRSIKSVHRPPKKARLDRPVAQRASAEFAVSPEETLRLLGASAASTIELGKQGFVVPPPLPLLPPIGDDGRRPSLQLIDDKLPTILESLRRAEARPDRDVCVTEILRTALRWAGGHKHPRPEKGRQQRLAGPLVLLALTRFGQEAGGEPRERVWPRPMNGRQALATSVPHGEQLLAEHEGQPELRHLLALPYEGYEEFGPPPPRVYATLKRKGAREAARAYAAWVLGISASQVRAIERRGDGVWGDYNPRPGRKLKKT